MNLASPCASLLYFLGDRVEALRGHVRPIAVYLALFALASVFAFVLGKRLDRRAKRAREEARDDPFDWLGLIVTGAFLFGCALLSDRFAEERLFPTVGALMGLAAVFAGLWRGVRSSLVVLAKMLFGGFAGFVLSVPGLEWAAAWTAVGLHFLLMFPNVLPEAVDDSDSDFGDDDGGPPIWIAFSSGGSSSGGGRSSSSRGGYSGGGGGFGGGGASSSW